MKNDIGMPGDPIPEYITARRADSGALIFDHRTRTTRLARPPRLTDAEADCLAVAVRATYMPGVVAVQTRFHGRENLKSRQTQHMLDELAYRGLLTHGERVHSADVDTTSWYYNITARGREASVPVVLRIKGAG